MTRVMLLLTLSTACWANDAAVRVVVDDRLHLSSVGCAKPPCEVVPRSVGPNGRDALFDRLPWDSSKAAVVEFVLPAGIEVSAPGRRIASSWTTYETMPSARSFGGILAVGRFRQRRIELPGGALDVAILDGQPAPDEASIMAWLEDAARHVVAVSGKFPVDRVQVVVVPVAGRGEFQRGRDEAVPFGRVLRGGGLAVQFFVDQTASRAALFDDWTATHEFSHLLLPYVRRADSWMSEGFASYYQNVLRARAGAYDEVTAWRKLVEGFGRGRREVYSESLTESIRHRGPNFLMRLYWSGAAIALLADVELRRGGANSLDEVVSALQSCCVPSGRSYSAQALCALLDRSGGGGVFSRLQERWVDAHQFPAVDDVLRDLGVVLKDGTVALNDAAPLAAVRRSIMSTSEHPDI